MSVEAQAEMPSGERHSERFVAPEKTQHPILSSDQSGSGGTLGKWLVVFLAAFALFAATANRGAQWQDSGFHILRVVTGQSVNPLGLALSHPLHHWLGRLIVLPDLLEACLAVTLISALAGAAAVANVYGCVLTLTRSQWASLLAAASLGLANTFWQMATLAETYTLTAALLSAECWCLVAYARANHAHSARGSRYLWLMCLFNGLGISNHLLASLTTPVVAVVVLHSVWHKAAPSKHIALALCAWLAGSSLYGGMVLAELMRSGDLQATIHSALFGHAYAGEVLNASLSPRLLLIGAGFVLLNFPNFLLPAAVYGIARAVPLGVPALSRRVLLAALAIHVCFAGRYNVTDQHMFFVPSYVLLSIFGGIGFATMLRRWRPFSRRVGLTAVLLLLALTPVVYAFVPSVARGFGVLRSVAHHKPYRDDYVYLFIPWSVVEDSAERMSRQAVALTGNDGLILVEDPMAEFAVRYRALRNGLDDRQVTRSVTAGLIQRAVGEARRVVLVPLNADAPKTDAPVGSWKRIGDLYLLGDPPPPTPLGAAPRTTTWGSLGAGHRAL